MIRGFRIKEANSGDVFFSPEWGKFRHIGTANEDGRTYYSNGQELVAKEDFILIPEWDEKDLSVLLRRVEDLLKKDRSILIEVLTDLVFSGYIRAPK